MPSAKRVDSKKEDSSNKQHVVVTVNLDGKEGKRGKRRRRKARKPPNSSGGYNSASISTHATTPQVMQMQRPMPYSTVISVPGFSPPMHGMVANVANEQHQRRNFQRAIDHEHQASRLHGLSNTYENEGQTVNDAASALSQSFGTHGSASQSDTDMHTYHNPLHDGLSRISEGLDDAMSIDMSRLSLHSPKDEPKGYKGEPASMHPTHSLSSAPVDPSHAGPSHAGPSHTAQSTFGGHSVVNMANRSYVTIPSSSAQTHEGSGSGSVNQPPGTDVQMRQYRRELQELSQSYSNLQHSSRTNDLKQVKHEIKSLAQKIAEATESDSLAKYNTSSKAVYHKLLDKMHQKLS